MKRGASVLLVVLILLNSSLAFAETSVVFAPTQAYETNHVSFSLNISNFRSAYEINKVSALASGFNILSLADYAGWSESYNGSFATWSDGSIANNVILSLFEFMAEAPLVTEDLETETSITLRDLNSQEHTYTFPITILNDGTAPILADLLPEDGGLVKEGTNNQQVQASVSDPETGVKNVSFNWVRCNFEENITPTEHTLQLAQYEGMYRNTIDLSSYDNEQQVCFGFTAYNNGGEKSEYEGTLTIDGIPPEVTLVSPVDGTITGLGRNFSFFASDNLGKIMDCRMYIDGNEYMEDIEAPNMDVVFIPSADVEEGQHTWSMRCSDPAGWEGQSSTWRYNLDKTPPRIVMTSPENNNSIIPGSSTLEFEVTDNYELNKVWFVIGDNRTEVEGVFSIDVTGWPEGPSEFAVIAEDSVHNQAEQTYRVIVDRTPPAVQLVSPADGAENDVHVNFTYRAQDNYDDAMDCKVYIDNTGYEENSASDGADTVWPRVLAIGEYRWKVQCVDDAGNTGDSDVRQLTVIDTSGPDIAANNPDEVFRGDLVPISLVVTDISGVYAVEAVLRDPDGNPQSIPLEKLGDTYAADVETVMDSKLGTYTLEVYAVDTLNNSNTAQDSIALTYKYTVALELEPSSVTPSSNVVASGFMEYDNGSMVPEGEVTLLLPGNVTQEVELNEEGEFSYAFTAPAQDGTYEVKAKIRSAGNSKEYSSTEQLTVATPYQGGGSGGGGSSSSRHRDDDDDGCSADWSCTAWSTCVGGNQERTCVDLNHCSDEDSSKDEERSCTVKVKEESDDEDDGSGNSTVLSAAREPVPEPEEYEAAPSEEDEGDAAGVGKASGFMSGLDLNIMNVLFALVLMGMLLGTLYKFGWSKGDGRKRPSAVDILGRRSNLGLESYLEERASRRGRF